MMLGVSVRAESTDYVRLHVLAENDTVEAQALKLQVRDAVLERARGLLEGVDSAGAAWRRVNDSLDELEDAARIRARACGYDGEIACETGIYAFPDRTYGDTVVPAGDYRAVRVVIGAGEGRNWWCVLYPSLCYPEDWKTEDGALYSSVWRWLRALFGGDGA